MLQERVWLRNQNQGELDDSKLVDGLTGDRWEREFWILKYMLKHNIITMLFRLVFKRRGYADKADDSAEGSGAVVKKKLQFVMDVSGSMYRFNGEDR